MLFGIDPIITPELLHVLASMGHGDEIVLVDCNFPAHSVAETTSYGSVIELAGVDVPSAVKGVLSLMPLDAFDQSSFRMDPESKDLPEVQKLVKNYLGTIPGAPWALKAIQRIDFYDRASNSFAVIRTTERRPYGCFLFNGPGHHIF